MHHCIKFKPDEVYYLEDTDLYEKRVLYVGFCPICSKPVTELREYSFTGTLNKTSASGINANNMMLSLKGSIICSAGSVYRKSKSKPFGWRYGVNKISKNGKIRQYACDFYGAKELVKKI